MKWTIENRIRLEAEDCDVRHDLRARIPGLPFPTWYRMDECGARDISPRVMALHRVELPERSVLPWSGCRRAGLHLFWQPNEESGEPGHAVCYCPSMGYCEYVPAAAHTCPRVFPAYTETMWLRKLMRWIVYRIRAIHRPKLWAKLVSTRYYSDVWCLNPFAMLLLLGLNRGESFSQRPPAFAFAEYELHIVMASSLYDTWYEGWVKDGMPVHTKEGGEDKVYTWQEDLEYLAALQKRIEQEG